jgi:glutamate N-acetyltransferase/amino-acid N-acetyltransferase
LLPSSPTGEPLTIDPTKVNVTFIPSDGTSPLPVLVNGEPEVVDEERAKEIMTLEDFEISVNLGMSDNPEGEAKYWTCDFSYVSLSPYLMNFFDEMPSGIRTN